jgi:hypothetical protein
MTGWPREAPTGSSDPHLLRMLPSKLLLDPPRVAPRIDVLSRDAGILEKLDAAKRQGLKQKRLSLYLAASDMDQAAAAAEALAAEAQNVSLMRALETALSACYGRPFTEGTMIQRLDKSKWVTAGADRELHERLMALRHQTYAHTDIESGRNAGSSESRTSGDTTLTLYAEACWPFPRDWIPAVIDLCRGQAQRFREEAAKIDEQLSSL